MCHITISLITMRAFLVLAIVGAAAAAPAGDARDIKFLEESQRTKKSPAYGGGGGPSYGLSSIPSAGPGYAPAAPCSGGAPLAPVTLFALAPQAALGPASLHYRENEHMEHQARSSDNARSYYDSSAVAASAAIAAAAASASAGAAAGAASAGPAIGLFPNAKVGNCAVPLLLSCAPSVVSGHLAHQPSYGGSAVGAYGSASASIAGGLAPSGYRAHETSNLEHSARSDNSEKATAMISEQKLGSFMEHGLPSMRESHNEMEQMKLKRAV